MKGYVVRLLALGVACAAQDDGPSLIVVISGATSESQGSPVGGIEIVTLNASDTRDRQPQSQELRRCSVEQLLPAGLGGDLESGWTPVAEDETRPRGYNSTSARMGGMTFQYARPKLAKDPFPPGTSILFYGNSPLRQVVEGIMCRYAGRVVRREASLMLGEDNRILELAPVGVDKQCRGCMPRFKEELTRDGCMHKEEGLFAMRCCDDQAVFEFDNGVTVHYWFAHHETNKSVEHAFQEFNTSVSNYDVIVANSGNKPVMDTERVIASAQHFHRVGVPFLWLSTYGGVGNVGDWEFDDREAFVAAKGNHVPVNDMMKTMGDFTMGAELGTEDDHFCLPGPPDELGLLVLQLIWALHEGAPAV